MGKLTKAQTRELERALDYLERGLAMLDDERGTYVLTRRAKQVTNASDFAATGDYGRDRYGEALSPVTWHGSGHTVASNAIGELRRILERDGHRPR